MREQRYLHIYSRIKTRVRVVGNRLGLFVYEKRRRKVALIEARTTHQINLLTGKIEKNEEA